MSKLNDILDKLYYCGYDQTGHRSEDVAKAKAQIKTLVLALVGEPKRQGDTDHLGNLMQLKVRTGYNYHIAEMKRKLEAL